MVISKEIYNENDLMSIFLITNSIEPSISHAETETRKKLPKQISLEVLQ